jgi:heme O synthase-like polyprenyltransferase
MPFGLHMTGPSYLTIAAVLGLIFLGFGLRAAITRTRTDARKLFFCSIIYLPLLLIALVIDKV